MSSRRKLLPVLTNTALTALLAASLILPTGDAYASSHREAPNITGSPRVDATDFYMFNSYEAGRTGYTTIIANYDPLQDAYGGPNYFALDPNAIYEIHIDNDGDAKENLTFQFKFTQSLAGGNGVALNVGGASVAVPLKNVGTISAGDSSKLNFIENYTATVIRGDRRTGTRAIITNAAGGSSTFTKPYDYIGNKTFTNTAGYDAYAAQYKYNVTIPGCAQPGRLFVGQRREGFSVNLGKVFDLVNIVPIDADSTPGSNDNGGYNGGIHKSRANNQIANKNITSIAMEVPTSCLTGTGNGVIGGWTTASLPQAKLLNPKATFALPEVVGGAYTQMSRLSMPLVNELVIGLKDKDHFNASQPVDDGQFATYVTNPTLPALLQVLFGVQAPNNFPRTDLVAAFLTGLQGVNQMSTVKASEMLRLNTTIAATTAASQSSYGVLGGDNAGFPNGRRPGDEVVDITLRVAMGKLCTLSLGGCVPNNAPNGSLNYTDGALVDHTDFDTVFPYLRTPMNGS